MDDEASGTVEEENKIPETYLHQILHAYRDLRLRKTKPIVYLDNSKSTTDALVVLQNKITGVKVRSQFIRRGEDLTMVNVPSGNYWIKQFDGNNWTYDAMMPDGVTRGGFTNNQLTSKIGWDCPSWRLCQGSLTLYLVEGGNIQSEQIDFNEFMK